MPHASTITRITPLKSLGEKSQRQCSRWSRRRWLIPDFYEMIDAKKVWRNLRVIWMMDKRNFFVLIYSLWDVKRGSVAQMNELQASAKIVTT
jgi:hypothetical protein